jgi:hypothetical protein
VLNDENGRLISAALDNVTARWSQPINIGPQTCLNGAIIVDAPAMSQCIGPTSPLLLLGSPVTGLTALRDDRIQ